MSFDDSRDYYNDLGISRNATKQEIVAAYNSISSKTPEVESAFKVLSDDITKKAYDDWTATPIVVPIPPAPDEPAQVEPAPNIQVVLPATPNPTLKQPKAWWQKGGNSFIIGLLFTLIPIITLFVIQILDGRHWEKAIFFPLIGCPFAFLFVILVLALRIINWILPGPLKVLLKPLSSKRVGFVLVIVIIAFVIFAGTYGQSAVQSVQMVRSQQVLTNLCDTAQNSIYIKGNRIHIKNEGWPEGGARLYFSLNNSKYPDELPPNAPEGGAVPFEGKLETLTLLYVKADVTGVSNNPISGSDGDIVQCNQTVDIKAAIEKGKSQG